MERMTGASLIKRNRNVVTPFLLNVKKSGEQWIDIKVIRVFRLLPKKRVVALADCQGQYILVKVFLGRHACRNSKRDVLGVSHITKAGVTTPALLWEGMVADTGELLAFEYLPDAISLDAGLQKFKGEREKLVSEIMKVMAQLHENGVVQKDIHLGNFLLSNGNCYTIDGGGVEKQSKKALSERASLKNLSFFFAQFPIEFDIFVPSAFVIYENARHWRYHHRRVAALLTEIGRSREVRKRIFMRKTLRDCTRFMCSSTFTRFMVCERNALNDELRQVLQDIDRFVDLGCILKSGHTATVSLVKLGHRSLVIKRYNVKGFFHALKLVFRNSRARTSWKNAFRLEFLGIPALRAIALIENRLAFFSWTSYLIAEFIEGQTVGEFLRDANGSDNKLPEMEGLRDIFSKLSYFQLSHGDLKASNLLISGHKPVLIDLDSMSEYSRKRKFRRAFRCDLERFMENWKTQPVIRKELIKLLSDLIEEFGVTVK